jgi:NAD(P)H-hydrate epimerase
VETRFSHEPPETGVFSREGVRALDKAAVEELAIPGILLMENAAAALEAACLQRANPCHASAIVVLAGPGNNGGDGFALARRLANRRLPTITALAFEPDRAKGDAATNLTIIQRMGLPIVNLTPGAVERQLAHHASAPATLIIIDALLGTGAEREPRGLIPEAIAWANARRAAGAFTLAVDIPSGLDCDTGAPIGAVAIQADLTVTLAGMKRGLRRPESRRWSGDVLVGDIGVPPDLLRRFSDA